MTGTSSDDDTNAVSPDETIAWIRSNLSRIEQFFTAAQAEHSCEQLIDLAKALATKYFGPSTGVKLLPNGDQGLAVERAFIMRLYLTRRAPGCQCSHCGTSGVAGSLKSSSSDASRAHVALRRADGQRRHRIIGRQLGSRTPAQLQ